MEGTPLILKKRKDKDARREEDKEYVAPEKLLPYFQIDKSYVGHQDEVLCVRVHKDRVYSSSMDGKIFVWDRFSYKQLSAFEGHEDAVNAIAVYDDKATGKVFIISASDDKTVGVYEKSSKLPQKVLKGHTGWVYAVAADDKHIYSAGFDGLVHVWDWDRSAAAAKDAQPTYQLKYTWKGHTGKINSICVDPSSSMIYTGSSDGTIMVWDKTQPNTDGPVSIFRGHTDGVHCVYSYKERLYSASYDRSVKIWEKATGKLLKSVPVNPDGTETHRGFLFDIVVQGEIPGTTQHPMKIYTSSYSGAVQTWHLLTGQNIQTLRRPGPTKIRSLTVDNDTIFAALTDGSIQTWHTVPGDPVNVIKDHSGSVKAVFVDESQFYTASVDKSIIIWNKKTQQPIKRLYGHERGLRCLYVRDNRIYSGSEDRTLIVWDKKTGDMLMKLVGHGGAVTTVFVDEGRIYTGSEDEKIRIWDKESGSLLHTINPEEAKVEEEEEPLPKTKTDYEQEKKEKKRKHGFVHNIVVYGDKIFTAVLKRIDVYNKLTYNFLGSLIGHKETVTGIVVYADPRQKNSKPKLYSSSEDGTVRVWSDNTLEISKKFTKSQKYYKEKSLPFSSHAGKIYSLHIDMGRLYVGTLTGEIEIMDLEDGKILKTLTGHTSWVYSLFVDEGRVYSGSFDQTVRVWDVECYQVPAFFQQCMAFETVYDHSTEYMDQRDSEDRSSLMICARAGSTENAHNLVRIGTKYGLTHTSKYGESAIFYALRTENWDFLRSFVDALKKQEAEVLRESALRESTPNLNINLNHSFDMGTIRTIKLKKGTIRETMATAPPPAQIKISQEDYATRQLLVNRAKAGDISFFEEFFKLGLSYESREVVAAAIEANHVWFCKRWKHINQDAVLHEACFYGRPDCVKELMKRRNININKKDAQNMNSLPVHICHMNADHSRMNNRNIERKKDDVSVLHGESMMKKEWVPENVWNRYEYDLIMKRTECFREICDTKEITKRPKYKEKNSNGRTSYDEALALHDYTMEAMKIPKKEITDRLENIHRKRLFYESEKVLDFYQQVPEIEAMRERFATKSFIKESVGYLVFLILLTTVGLLMSTNGSGSVYQMNSGLSSYLLGDAFEGIGDEGSFWDYFNSNFLPAVFPEGNVTQSDGYIMGFNKIVGAIRFRQLKVRDDSCKIRSLYASETSTCYAPQYSTSTQDTSPFGPEDKWTYDHNAGDRYWTETDATWLPAGGYIADIPSDSLDSATNVLTDLQENGWITPGTRYVLVSMNVYNGNETGLLGVLRLEFAFTASGVVLTSSDFSVWGPNGYDVDILPAGVIKIILQLIVLLYILYAFLFTEFTEIRQAIADAREFINSLKKHNLANEVGDPIWEGLKDYWSQLWNYYEWTIIIVFIILVGMEISVIAGFNAVNLHPDPSTYINLQTITTTANFETDLLALFILMNWLRLLKFLRIPKFTGPMVQSVMDTLQNAAVIVFVFIVFYIVLVFSLCYHIAFGPDLPEYATYAESAISIFQGLFGGPDYGSLLASNAVFGPVLFVFFMLFTIVLLMNLLIGVLGDAYNDAQTVNLSVWNRFITRLMIESMPSRCVPDSVKAEKRGFFDRIRRRGLWQQLNDDLMEKAASAMEPDDENAETPIYYDDGQLDDMVCGEDKEQFENQIEFEISALEVEEAKKLLLVKKEVEKTDEEKMMDRLENLEKNNDELKEQNKKMSEQLDLLVKLMTQNAAANNNSNNNNQ